MDFIFNSASIDQPLVIAITFVLTIDVLILSVFVSVYSSFTHDFAVADVYVYSYALQSDAASEEKEVYQKIAQEWLRTSEIFRDRAKSRAYSVIWSLIALLLTFITFVLLIFGKNVWSWSILAISVVFLLLASGTYFNNWKFPFLDFSPIFPGVKPDIARWPEIEQVINSHDWLFSHLQNLRAKQTK